MAKAGWNRFYQSTTEPSSRCQIAQASNRSFERRLLLLGIVSQHTVEKPIGSTHRRHRLCGGFCITGEHGTDRDAIERQRQIDIQAESDSNPSMGALAETQWSFSQSAQPDAQSLELHHAADPANPPQLVRTDAEYERAKNYIALVVKPFVPAQKKVASAGQGDGRCSEYQYPVNLIANNMTEEQWIPFAICMKQSRLRRLCTSQGRSCQPMQMILNGEGGSGKSWLLRHIVKDMHKVWDELATSVRQSKRVLLMAHHGSAAFNIKGTTICSCFGFGANTRGFNQPYQQLGDYPAGIQTLRKLQDKYKDVQLVIVDEYSVISCGMLHWMDRRMREIWPDGRDLPFGGRDVILAGDMGQLPSVMPASLATALKSLKNATQVNGRRLWESIQLVCTLKSQQRGADDPQWFNALKRLRHMDETSADLRLFNTRHFARDQMPVWTSNAIHIAYRNDDVDAANAKCLQRSRHTVYHVSATHSVLPNLRSGDVSQPLGSQVIDAAIDEAEQPNAERDRTLPRSIDLAVGVPVVLTHNLAQSAGLCNGTHAIVYDLIYARTTALPIVLVEIQGKYIGPSFLPEREKIVPIPPQSQSWLSRCKTYRTTRTSLPLRLGYAMTIHKVQGLTCSKLVFDPVAIPTSTFAYVGLSRVRHRENVVLTQSLQPIRSKTQKEVRAMRHEEWKRLEALDQATRLSTRTLVNEMKAIASLVNYQQ